MWGSDFEKLDICAVICCKLSLRKRVFGPSAQQRDLYDQAVIPMVHEVLEGFNCTKRSETDTEDVDDLCEVVKVNNEGGAVSGGDEEADVHEHPILEKDTAAGGGSISSGSSISSSCSSCCATMSVLWSTIKEIKLNRSDNHYVAIGFGRNRRIQKL
nr:kinesin-like protein kin-5c [Quercus suber]